MDCCDLCGCMPSKDISFHCATCVRTALYPLRLEQAAVLLDKEAMGQKVEAVVRGGIRTQRENISLSGAIIDTAECGKAYEVERMQAEAVALNHRVDLIAERVAALKREMDETKRQIAARKAENKLRSGDATSATAGLEYRSKNELQAVRDSIGRGQWRWNQQQQKTVFARIDLCRAAAKVAGLKRARRVENGKKVELITIADSLPVFDLRELHTAHPEVLTASLTQLAYLTHRVSVYLGLRLPAEIILPHKDYPLPTIFHPESSYTTRVGSDIKFPGLTSGRSSSTSPTASKILESRNEPRPRPLFAYKDLPKMLKEEPVAVSRLIEGIALLAWDVAWLCKIHGMRGLSSWRDICPIGENLWQLLVASPADSAAQSSDGSERGSRKGGGAFPELLGQRSHATAHSFFGVEHVAMMDEWKLRPSEVMKAVYKIKRHLIGAIKGPEWEVIDEAEWSNTGYHNQNGGRAAGIDHDDMAAEEPVMVGGKRWQLDNNNRSSSSNSVAKARPGVGDTSRRPSQLSTAAAARAAEAPVVLSRRSSTASTPKSESTTRPRAAVALTRKGSVASTATTTASGGGGASAAPATAPTTDKDKGDIWMKVRSRNGGPAS